ncbi:MAG TPA: DedA family protein [Candidatus Binataceae bacterium]|jgi:membrane protein DedA with SNARE-associated domain|nr:DedA family protein [Candidatus Binataceae bacterium]
MHHALDPHNIARVLETWGYVGIFVCVFVGNLGLPVPEESVVLAAGFLAGRDIMDLKAVMVVAFVSAVVGDNFGYMLGRTGGRQVLVRAANSSTWLRWRYVRFKVFFEAHGNKTIFLARFIAGLRFIAGPMAGALEMPFWRFFGWNVSGAAVWCAVVAYLGFVLGDQWESVARHVHTASPWVMVGAIVLIAGVYPLWLRHRAVPRIES